MGKLTKLELDSKLKEWVEEAKNSNSNLQKGIGGGLLVVVLRRTGKADFYCRKPFTRIGAVNKVTLANAYKKVEELKPKKVARKARSQNSIPTLKTYFPEWVEEKSKSFKKGSSRPSNLMCLFAHTLTPLHNLKLNEITAHTVYERLNALDQTDGNKHNAVTALNDCLNSAILKGIIEANLIQGINPFKKPKAKGFKSVPYDNLRSTFFEPLKNTNQVNKVFYLLLALVGFRFGECRLLRWDWVDFKNELIIIPPDAEGANKTQTEYKKVLSRQTVSLLKKWKQQQASLTPDSTSNYVFATMDPRFNGAMCEGTFREPIKALTSREQDLHGFRKCIKTYLMDNGFNAYESELVLSHDIRNSIEKTYDKGERLEEVRKASQAWADYLEREQLPDEFLELI